DLAPRDARAVCVRIPARHARVVLAGRGAAGRRDREGRGRAGGERHHLTVGGDPGETHAGAGGATAVGVGGARTEAVRGRVGRASLLADGTVQHVGVGDRLPDDDRGADRRGRRRGAGRGGRRRGRCRGRGGCGRVRGRRGRRRGCRGGGRGGGGGGGRRRPGGARGRRRRRRRRGRERGGRGRGSARAVRRARPTEEDHLVRVD